MKSKVVIMAAMIAGTAMAQQATGGRGAFIAQQAYDEAHRLAGQIDVIQSSVDDNSARIAKLEARRSNDHELEALKSRIAALEASNAELRRQLGNQRTEIVNDLSKRIDSANRQAAQAARPQPAAVGPHREYVVQSGDTLSIIAEAFNTKVSTIKQMNGLKNDNLRIGQKIKVPLN